MSETVEPIFVRFKCVRLLLDEYKRRAMNNSQSDATIKDPSKASQSNGRALSKTHIFSSPPSPQPNADGNPEKTSICCVRIDEGPGVCSKITVEKYDTSSNRFKLQLTLPTINVRLFESVLYGNKVFVIGGQSEERQGLGNRLVDQFQFGVSFHHPNIPYHTTLKTMNSVSDIYRYRFVQF